MYIIDIINIDHKIVSIHFVSLSNYTIKSVKFNLNPKINHLYISLEHNLLWGSICTLVPNCMIR
jgi:hypothetical protein